MLVRATSGRRTGPDRRQRRRIDPPRHLQRMDSPPDETRCSRRRTSTGRRQESSQEGAGSGRILRRRRGDQGGEEGGHVHCNSPERWTGSSSHTSVSERETRRLRTAIGWSPIQLGPMPTAITVPAWLLRRGHHYCWRSPEPRSLTVYCAWRRANPYNRFNATTVRTTPPADTASASGSVSMTHGPIV